MEPSLSEDPFLVLHGEDADNDDDIYPDPDTMIEYGDTAQLDKGVADRMEDNLSDTDTESHPEYLLFLYPGGILLMFLLLLIMTVCVTLTMRNTRQDSRQKNIIWRQQPGDNSSVFRYCTSYGDNKLGTKVVTSETVHHLKTITWGQQ